MTVGIHYEVTAADIAAIAAQAAFGRRLVTNVQRGLIAEAIVSSVLCPAWDWCSVDYAAWDFERSDGVRLEVKQAASRQSWHKPGDPVSRSIFDVRQRTGRWEGTDWMSVHRRWADVYVFAHHDVADETADHRDPRQWGFYVVAERALPLQGTLALTTIRKLARLIAIEDLLEAVEVASRDLTAS